MKIRGIRGLQLNIDMTRNLTKGNIGFRNGNKPLLEKLERGRIRRTESLANEFASQGTKPQLEQMFSRVIKGLSKTKDPRRAEYLKGVRNSMYKGIKKLGFHKLAASWSFDSKLKPTEYTTIHRKNSAAIKAKTLLGRIKRVIRSVQR
jgi:hypothetical protein